MYVAFITDVYSRRIIGQKASQSLHTDLASDALQMAIYQRRHDGNALTGLVHHSDRGAQYRAVQYGHQLADCQAIASGDSQGDSYDNTLAEALNSLYKTKLIRNHGPWQDIDDIEYTTAQ